MSTLFVKDIQILVTMDDARREIQNGAILIEGGVIKAVGTTESISQSLQFTPDRTLSLKNHIVIPGLVNTHHHMFQALTRVVAQQNELFGWLTSLYPIWQNLTGEMVYTSAKIAMAELMLSGCTTSSDHHYLYPNDVTLDDTIRAAQNMRFRFHPTRGSMSVGESKGGLPPDSIVELDEEAILKDTRRIIETYHDPARYSMLRMGVAPTAPFNVSQDLMRESASLARSYGVRLHTHLAENIKDISYSLETFGMRPGDYAEDVGWVGDDVWHAHCVQLDSSEIQLFGKTGTGVCHCPGSNMRLASGIAPLREMVDQQVKVGLGVDGSASNDAGNLLAEARLAMFLQRVKENPDPARFTAREALDLATRGGASVLGRDDIGALSPNMAADFAAYRIDTPYFAGAGNDLVAALVFCQPAQADCVVINGDFVVEDGHFVHEDLMTLIQRHNGFSQTLFNSV